MTRIELHDYDANQLSTALPKLLTALEADHDHLAPNELQALYELKDALDQATWGRGAI